MAFSVTQYLNAGYPILYVRTVEHARALEEVLADLRLAGLNSKYAVMVWKSTIGLYELGTDSPYDNKVATTFDEALDYIGGSQNPEGPYPNRLYIMLSPNEFMKSPAVQQLIKDAAYAIRAVASHIIMIGVGSYTIPEEITDVVTTIDLELPTKEKIKSIFKSVTSAYEDALTEKVTDRMLDSAADNALGLTAFKAENAISLSIVTSKKIDIPLIRQEKQLAVKQSGVLEYVPHEETLDTLGGFANLKRHVLKRKKYFTTHKDAVDFGLRPPKGIMLVGIAGTGKSLAAKAVSAALELPLYKFDVGAVFKGVVGGSESAIRNALKLAETVSPCVLLIDEMEKLLSGLESSGRSDSGVTSRVIGTLISWMQDTKSPVYKLATCNTIRNLDSALFRRGRWDAVFAVDLPTKTERESIFAIHLEKRHRDPANFDLEALADATKGFVGAEIESVVDEALYVAFDAEHDISTSDMLTVISDVVPISKTDEEAIEDFRRWMDTRATPVGEKEEPLPQLNLTSTAAINTLRSLNIK